MGECGKSWFQLVQLVDTDIAPGHSESQILLLFGKPRNVEGPIGLKEKWPFARNADANWLYDAGDLHTLVLSFRQHRCFHAEVCDYGDDILYQRWKADQIGADVQGRTDLDIISKYGLPQFETRECIMQNSMGKLEYMMVSSQVSTTEPLGADGLWCYETGHSTAVELTINNHRCIKFDQLQLWH